MLRELRPGRFSIKCVEAANVRRKDQTTGRTRMNPYLRFALRGSESGSGSGSSSSRRRVDDVVRVTRTLRGTGKDPYFKGEILTFDISDPHDYVRDGDVRVVAQVLDETERGGRRRGGEAEGGDGDGDGDSDGSDDDTLLGEVTFSALRFLRLRATRALRGAGKDPYFKGEILTFDISDP